MSTRKHLSILSIAVLLAMAAQATAQPMDQQRLNPQPEPATAPQRSNHRMGAGPDPAHSARSHKATDKKIKPGVKPCPNGEPNCNR
jgi:hypothetical protein